MLESQHLMDLFKFCPHCLGMPMIILIIITILANLIIIIIIKTIPTEKKPAAVSLPCNFLAGSS